jgi:hypothetical protein
VRIVACIEDPVIIEKVLTHQEANAAEPAGMPVAALPGAAPGELVRLINRSAASSADAARWRSGCGG